MRTIHQGPRAPSPDSQAEYTQAIRPRYLPFFENALAFGGSPYTRLGLELFLFIGACPLDGGLARIVGLT